MTLGFDFDQLDEDDGTAQIQADSPAELEPELPRSERTPLPGVVQRGASGRPRGLCLRCQGCRGWAPSSSSTASPPESRVDEDVDRPSEQADAGDGEACLEARGQCLPSLCGALPTFDGRRFTWPSYFDRSLRSETGSWGEHRPCARCGCPESDHEDVQAKFQRFLTERGSIPLAALRWSQVEIALWGDTEGLFWPGGRRSYCADEQKPGVLVSVICPTTSSRSCFHPFLWHCFTKQEHSPRELVVIDTSEGEPSAFLEEKARSDSRLLYKHFRVPEKKWCIGLKRNLACYYAAGQVIAHFDDDDMYSPVYISVMLKCLRDPREAFVMRHMTSNSSAWELHEMFHALNLEDTPQGPQQVKRSEEALFWTYAIAQDWGAACAKLCSWFSFTLEERSWCHCDQTDSDVPFTKDTRQGIYGWGFSLVYLRTAWQASPFLHIGLGEDLDFVQSFRRLGLPLVLVPDRKGICAHCQHLENISGTCVKGGSRGVTPSALLYSPLASVLSWYEMTAQGFTNYQKSQKDGAAGKVAAPVLLLPDDAEAGRAKRDAVRTLEREKTLESLDWVPGMKWTVEAVVAMQEELLRGFLDEQFQLRLHEVWKEFHGQPRQQEVERRSMCFEVQGPVLIRYGFEYSYRGLFQSSQDCRLPDEKVGLRDYLMQWLTHPGHKAWPFLWHQLAALRSDRSLGALRAAIGVVFEATQGDGQR
uniref:Glycosyltransferase 2-like domain-containing protein n=1 Tax=Alexandrium monilatum TaxID=311494 RepID=A0A7S4VYA4_9DINO|mmetsp:Transcript_102033/g.304453  ORF Transcript_102033/g.304453 Transcript_102033/m.304453 type:complete len:703 (+) Transcript_102033:66-2174(+)